MHGYLGFPFKAAGRFAWISRVSAHFSPPWSIDPPSVSGHRTCNSQRFSCLLRSHSGCNSQRFSYPSDFFCGRARSRAAEMIKTDAEPKRTGKTGGELRLGTPNWNGFLAHPRKIFAKFLDWSFPNYAPTVFFAFFSSLLNVANNAAPFRNSDTQCWATKTAGSGA